MEWDSDTSVGDPSFVAPLDFQLKQEILNEDSSTSMSASSISESVPHTSTVLMAAYSNPTDSVPPILNGRYFSIIRKITDTAHQKSANGIIASCELCPNKRTIKGSLKITSNFVQHLKMKHHQFYEKYLCEKKNKVKTIRKGGLKFEQSIFEDRLLQFIVNTYTPISIVEELSFINLFTGTPAKMVNKQHITNLLETKFNLLMASLKESLKSIQYVCTTADTWTNNKKLFFVYTCHWIDPDFTRHSATLACRRYSKTHPVDKIPELIQSLNTNFGLDEEKLVCTITYNGSHFENQFKEFGHYETADNNSSNEDSEDEIEFVSGLVRQPKQQRCGTHTLNLLATTIFNKLLAGHQETHEIHQTTFNRCFNIWTKCNKPEMAGIFKDVLGCSLETPKISCWTTLINSLRNLLKHKDRLDDLCLALCVEKFHSAELQYMKEYCLVMEVIAERLHFLQKENNSLYGYFLPTLVTIKVKLTKLHISENLNYLKELAKEMNNALVDSFKDIFEINPSAYDYHIATMSCPSIKMKFINALKNTTSMASPTELQALFVQYATEFYEEDPDQPGTSTSSKVLSSVEDNFFDFDQFGEETKPIKATTPLVSIEYEIKRYLQDPDNRLSSLGRHPTVKKMFMKFNTPLASSGPVEGLFSFAEIAKRQRLQLLTNKQFEQIVILKANKII